MKAPSEMLFSYKPRTILDALKSSREEKTQSQQNENGSRKSDVKASMKKSSVETKSEKTKCKNVKYISIRK